MDKPVLELSVRYQRFWVLLGALVCIGASLVGGCTKAAPRKAVTEAALEPFEAERADPLIALDSDKLYDPPDNPPVLPLLMATSDPLPATLAALTPQALATLLLDPATIRRIDVRIAHSPEQWPAGARPEGDPVLAKVVQPSYADIGSPALQSPARRLLIYPGETLNFAQVNDRQTTCAGLLEYLASNPALLTLGREAMPGRRRAVTDPTWVELKIRVNAAPPVPSLVPRIDIAAPLAARASSLLEIDPKTEPPPADEFTGAINVQELPHEVTTDGDGILLMQSVDANATLYSWTVDYPTEPDATMLGLAAYLTTAFLQPIPDS